MKEEKRSSCCSAKVTTSVDFDEAGTKMTHTCFKCNKKCDIKWVGEDGNRTDN